ncbi:hypothetical protein CYMTET_31753 [Cymbomonas tetramitiformis]|uniref:PI31 proteasome regulator N-terminal domain-containing protein n=1 Tax=Cymbomonas tetramitiformis TaxID=36881 RepID=A0AAE0FG74_9CHLO|nr:hypothetical protein CYMTET_31753 [Cymbomonas tetramitiformis]
MVSTTIFLALVRAAHPTFRGGHDRIAFAVHAIVLSEGYYLVGVGEGVNEDSGIRSSEVPIDGWNAADTDYALEYYHPVKKVQLLVKAVSVNSELCVSVLEDKDQNKSPAAVKFVKISVPDFTTGAEDLATGYQQLPQLINLIHTSLLSHSPTNAESRTISEGMTSAPDSAVDSITHLPEDQRGFRGSYSESQIGPHHPVFSGRFEGGNFVPGQPHEVPPGLPHGARYDPIAPFPLPFGFRQPANTHNGVTHIDLPEHRGSEHQFL